MALDTGLTHLFQMTGNGTSESNVAPGATNVLTLSDSSLTPDADAGPAPPAGGSFLSFPTNEMSMIGPNGEVMVSPGAGPINATVFAWVRLDNLNGGPLGHPEKVAVAEGSQRNTTVHHVLFFDGGGTDRAAFRVNQSDQTVITTTGSTFGTLSINTWYLFVGLLDGDNSRVGISVNGGTPDYASWDGSMYNVGTTRTILSHFNDVNSGDLNGDMSELGVYSRVLSSSELTEMYNGGEGIDLLNLPGGGGHRLLLMDVGG